MKKIISVIFILLLTVNVFAGDGHDTHEGHDHGSEAVDHAAHNDDLHDNHDHGATETKKDKHEGHNHSLDAACSSESVEMNASAAEKAEHEGDDHGSNNDSDCSAKETNNEGDDHAEQGDEGIALSEQIISKMGIKIAKVQGGTLTSSVTFPAEIKLNRDQTSAISARYPSIVRQIFAEIGDDVKKGDVLASLENRGTMAVYTVSAPLDGVIISKNLAAGETASEDKVLYEVSDLSSVWSDISIFPKYHHLISKGMKVTFIAHDGHTAEGSVKYVSPIVSHETRTYTARCVLEKPGEDFAPGAFVRANIGVKQVTAEVVVPREAVQKIDGESVVFVPGDHGFIAAPVQTGVSDDSHVEIHSGLKPNDHYVSDGAFALKAQMVTSGMDPHAGHGH